MLTVIEKINLYVQQYLTPNEIIYPMKRQSLWEFTAKRNQYILVNNIVVLFYNIADALMVTLNCWLMLNLV